MKDKRINVQRIVIDVMLVGLTVLLTYYFSIKSIDYEYAVYISENGLSEAELLKKAQKYFDIEDYISALGIYTGEKMETNPIALNNIAYMYENGILYERNLDKAREYYRKAHNLENTEAQNNWIRFNILYPQSYYELIDLITDAHKKRIFAADDFIRGFIPDSSNQEVEDFLKMDHEDIIELFRRQQYEINVDELTAHHIGKEFVSNVEIKKKSIVSDVGSSVGEYKYKNGYSYLSKCQLMTEIESIDNEWRQNVFYYSSLKENKPSYIRV